MARNQKSYDNEYKAQAVKLAQEIGGSKAAKELGIPDGTIYCWIKAFKEGRLSAAEATHVPKNALSLNDDERIELRKRVKEQEKEIRRLKEENEFLEEASAFFAASRRKSAKNRDSCFLQLKQKTAKSRAKFLFLAECLKFPDKLSTII